jgi:hypothetical protein
VEQEGEEGEGDLPWEAGGMVGGIQRQQGGVEDEGEVEGATDPSY